MSYPSSFVFYICEGHLWLQAALGFFPFLTKPEDDITLEPLQWRDERPVPSLRKCKRGCCWGCHLGVLLVKVCSNMGLPTWQTKKGVPSRASPANLRRAPSQRYMPNYGPESSTLLRERSRSHGIHQRAPFGGKRMFAGPSQVAMLLERRAPCWAHNYAWLFEAERNSRSALGTA